MSTADAKNVDSVAQERLSLTHCSDVVKHANQESSHYQFVYDKDQVRQFARLLLSDLDENTSDRVKLIIPIARKKYYDGLPEMNLHLGRQMVRSADPDRLLQTLQRYECPVGTFDYFAKGDVKRQHRLPIPGKAIVLYMTVNSKSTLSAWAKTNDQLTRALLAASASNKHHKTEHEENLDEECDHDSGHDSKDETKSNKITATANPINLFNLEHVWKGNVHRSTAESRFLDMDIDTKDAKDLKLIGDMLLENKLTPPLLYLVVETHGGYHALLDKTLMCAAQHKMIGQFCSRSKFGSKDRRGKSITKQWISVDRDSQIPIAGTLQGGFRVRLIPCDEFLTKVCQQQQK